MGVEGCAYATVIAQAISAVCCLIYIIKKFPILHLKKENFEVSFTIFLYLLALGIPMGLQFSITAIGTIIVQSAVNIYGATMAHVTCDTLIVKLTLQQYDGGWINYGTYGDTATNAASMSRSYNVKVKGGHYYRVKVACVAKKNGSSESQVPITNGIWID